MKKQALHFQQLKHAAVLTRNQLKDINGGLKDIRPSKEGEYCNWMEIKCASGLKCTSTNNPQSPDQGKCQR